MNARMKKLCLLVLAVVSPSALSASAAFPDATGPSSSTSLTLQEVFTPATADLGKPISIFLAALLPQGAGSALFARTPAGWQQVNSAILPPLQSVTAASSHTVDIAQNIDPKIVGGARIFVGYGLESASTSASAEMLQSQRYRQVYTVSSAAASGAPSGPSYVSACPADISTPLFGTSPLDSADFLAFRPLGFMSAPINVFPTKHAAFSMTAIGQTAVPKPFKAPGKAYVTEIYEATFSSNNNKNYQVFMHPCREVRVYIGHLVSISDKLLTEFNKAASVCNSFNDGSGVVTTCRRENLNVEVAEGEVLGTGPDSAGIDFGTLDYRRSPAAFINLEHYDTFYPYYTSPLDYFTPTVRQAIEAKTGNIFGTKLRTATPIGGTYMQDLAGTAQGNWFLPGKYHKNTTDLSIFIALAHDYVDPTQPLMSSGSIKGMTLGLYSYTVAQTGLFNRDFSAIRADGNIYCIDAFTQGQTAGGLPTSKPSGVLLLSMPDDLTIKAELAPGTSCSAATLAHTSNAVTFVR